jgi:hypothetical protein
MASYRLLQDHYVADAGGTLLSAGQVVTTGKELPSNWVPTNNCEPMDADATNVFWNAGPVLAGPFASQFSTLFVAPPKTFWEPVGNGFWQLVGLGSALAPRWAWRI